MKRGKYAAQLVLPARNTKQYPQQACLGIVTILGDVVEPVLPTQDGEEESDESHWPTRRRGMVRGRRN